MKKLTSMLILLALVTATVSAQFGIGGGPKIAFSKSKILNGDPSVLNGKVISVEFIYDGMAVGKFKKEEDYIAKKRGEYNEKEAGRGDKWAEKWKSDRKTRYEPSFIEKFNELGSKTKTKVQKEAGGADYKLVITTTFTEPGYNVVVAREPARINTICDFQDMTGKSVVKVAVDKVPGQTFGGYDYDTGVRLSESYEKLGKDLYKTISKKFK